MALTNSSLSSRATISVNGRRGSELTQNEEVLEEWRDGREQEQQREVERETYVNDGIALVAETTTNHRVAADKHKFNTAGRQRKPKQKVVSDFATVSKGVAGNVKPRPALIHVLFNQGPTDKSSMPEERDQLDTLKDALETFPVPACLSWTRDENGIETKLEDKWTDIVPSHVTMSKTQRHQQEALWELIHTELTYINKLTIVTDLVMAAFTCLQQNGFLEVKPEQIFSNLPSIVNAHRLFWQDVIYPMLLEARRTGKPFDPLRLKAGCMQFPERFSPYLQYCWQEEQAVELARNLTDTNQHFHTYVSWVESHPQCGRMRLGDMQAKPHQRITKYPLLLKAILKNTQDPHTQLAVIEMLASVNGFLEDINNYLRLKDEELALAVSAQKIEGYSVVEGTNEEIDKIVKTFCCFDLRCPIRGVGLGVIRKLLFEGPLKIRGRKDNKMEVIALLFSDVLLITKAQKKAKRLKVVRPPMALERIRFAALKDSCSFVLVEVSVLGCAVDLHTFSTNNADYCSTWQSNIKKAQDDLHDLRETEASRQWQIQKRDMHLQEPAKHFAEPKLTKEESVDQQEVTAVIPSANGTLASVVPEAKEQTQHPLDKDHKDALLPGQHQKGLVSYSQSIHGGSTGLLKKNGHIGGKVMERVVVLEAGLRDIGGVNQLQKEDESRAIKERRVTWNHSKHSNSQPRETAETSPPQPNGPLEGYPEVDYLPNTSSTSPSSTGTENYPEISITVSQMGVQNFPSQGSTSPQSQSDPQTVDMASSTDPSATQLGEEEASNDLQRFSRKLNSPRLRRRRPINSQQAPGPPRSRRGSESSGMPQYVPRRSSSSNSESNYPYPGLSRQRPDPPVVLNLGSVNKNKGVFWEQPTGRDFSPESYTFSDTEYSPKRPSKKTQRSSSIPDNYQGRHGWVLPSVRQSNVRIAPSPPPGLDPFLHPSPVEALLDRAKERKKDGGKREEKGTWNLPLSSSFPISPSQSPSDGEVEWKAVELVRRPVPTVSQRWTEEEVDGEEEEKKSSPALHDGASVDWLRWHRDDDEILDHPTPEDSGVGVDEENDLISDVIGVNRFMRVRDSLRVARQEDRVISHV